MSGTTPAITSILYNGGHAKAHRAVVAADYGVVWRATRTFSLEDQVNYSSAQQPGYSIIPQSSTMQVASGALHSAGRRGNIG
jgi:hypothetical protein